MIGQAFMPSISDEEERKKRMMGAGGPIQEAIKILSMRIPRFQGAGGIAPMELLSGQGMAGTGAGSANPIVEAILRQFGLNNPAGGIRPDEPTPGSMTPGPVVVPGAGGSGTPPSPPPSAPKPKIDFTPPPQPQPPMEPRNPFSRMGRQGY